MEQNEPQIVLLSAYPTRRSDLLRCFHGYRSERDNRKEISEKPMNRLLFSLLQWYPMAICEAVFCFA